MIRKLLLTALMIALMSTIVGIFGMNEVRAANYYDYGCGVDYEVSYIEDDGSLSKVSCHSNFAEAKKKMQSLGEDYVVRNANSLSPTKIIAMNSGIAYSYPTRSGSSTMTIYSTPNYKNEAYKTTYVSIHYEMFYYDTERIVTNGGLGMIEVELNGFRGYCDLEYTDLVPMKYIRNSIPIWLGGNDKTSENEQPFKTICRQNYFEVTKNGNYYDLVFHFYRAYHSPGLPGYEPVASAIAIGPAMDFMKAGVKYYSNDAISFYLDDNLTDFAGKGYNYYQFLPLRTKSDISASTMDSYIIHKMGASTNSVMKNAGADFVSNQDIYGMNAALVYGLSVHESAFGTSSYAIYRNNLFGWNAFDSDPSKATYFESVSQAIKEHMGINLRKYISIEDFRFFNSSLGNTGAGINVKYASDPYWGLKIASHIYGLDKYANDNNGKLTDYNKYKLALVEKKDAKVYSEPSTASDVLYTTGYGDDYQKDMIVVILEEIDGFTKIQTTDPVGSDGKIISAETDGLVEYDFERSVGYILTSDLQYLNCNKSYEVVAGDYVANIKELSIDEKGMLIIKGEAYRQNIPNEEYEAAISLILKSKDEQTLDITQITGDGDALSFSSCLDLSLLDVGDYSLIARTSYKNEDFNGEAVLDSDILPPVYSIEGKIISFKNDEDGLAIKIEEVPSEGFEVLTSLREMKLADGFLQITGVAAIKGIDFVDQELISHLIVLENYKTGETVEFAAKTIDAGGYNVNDGHDYQYAGFEAKIALSDIASGEYLLKIKVKNNGLSSLAYLKSSRSEFTDRTANFDDKHFKICANPLYGYRLELSCISTPLDYQLINKPDSRNSLSSFDAISISDDLELIINGHAMMYYLDYSDDAELEYDVYLVKDNKDYRKMETANKACPVDYSALLNSSYDMSNICFEAKTNIQDLEGEYQIVVAIENGEYLDYVEIPNRSYRKTPSIKLDNKSFEVLTSPIRYRLYLNITGE